MYEQEIAQAAALIKNADALLITAGAGMGVDSGLPDFRGNEGFWKAYPALAASRVEFSSIANPHAFLADPKQAWGFYGHRLALYRKTVPHEGFQILRDIAARMRLGCFVITSNVDGQFQKAGFDASRILEIHGSIHHLQCMDPCRETVWPADYLTPKIDEEKCEWTGQLPTCLHCGCLARPNVLMFDDWHWQPLRHDLQRGNWRVWSDLPKKMVVIELGAGIDIPSIRRTSEAQRVPVIRINPRHPEVRSETGVSLPMGAKDALVAIWKLL
ncbi:SIR2 family NAD-dependent protein deacylase [Propionivibrio limicola]|uniref:SIR2 family NAD-dependent protein deacylase n=1 Tax=Propionivibrio limicola TaxID=167645 RepID=UPI001291A138|nr:Sir2 family NAD-dependent protein deacetylase [Propionivibrio limicola]